MDSNPQEKWYHKTWALIVGFLAVGPFVLPVVWNNPRFSLKTKVIITAIILIITYFLVIFLMRSIKVIYGDYSALTKDLM